MLCLGLWSGFTNDLVVSAKQFFHSEPQNSQTIDFLEAAANIDPKGSMGGGDITILDDTALVPDSGPSGTIADIKSNDYQGDVNLYVVREGDTLPKIAKLFQINLNTILWANNLNSNSAIHKGDTLIILPIDGVQHTVKRGDTIQGIAKKYGAKVSDILEFNDLIAGQVIEAGDTLLVPNGTQGGSLSGTTPKASTHLTTSLPSVAGYFSNPLPGARRTQGIHGYNGVDLAASTGTPILAAADGVVVVSHFRPLTDPWFGGYGNYVDINHPNGTQTRYAHMSAVYVSVGAQISKGQPIGEVGSTGKSTGPHLHFEVHGAKNPF